MILSISYVSEIYLLNGFKKYNYRFDSAIELCPSFPDFVLCTYPV